MPKAEEVFEMKLDKLVGHDDNPNVMTDAQFNKLVENIQEVGFIEPIQVAKNNDGTWTIIGGHHRVKAATLLGYTELPCIEMKDMAEGADNWEHKRLFHLVRLNIIKGKIDPMKFTEMFDRLSDQYGRDVLKESFSFWDERSFQSVYKSIKAQLPPELQEKLEKAKSEIKTIDDIARILNRIFNESGETVDIGYVWFSYGGQDHWYVRMEKPLFNTIKDIEKQIQIEGGNVNDILIPIMLRGWEAVKNDER